MQKLWNHRVEKRCRCSYSTRARTSRLPAPIQRWQVDNFYHVVITAIDKLIQYNEFKAVQKIALYIATNKDFNKFQKNNFDTWKNLVPGPRPSPVPGPPSPIPGPRMTIFEKLIFLDV